MHFQRVLTPLFLIFLLLNTACDRKWSNIYDPESDITHEFAPKNLQVSQVATHELKLVWEHGDDRVGGFLLDQKIGETGSWNEGYRLIDKDFREIRETVEQLEIPVIFRLYAFADEALSLSVLDTLIPSFPPPESLGFYTISESGVMLSWDPHPYTDVNGYQIERKKGSNPYIILDTLGTTAYQDTTLSSTETYTYQVKAKAGTLLSVPGLEKTIYWQTGDYSLAWETNNPNGVHKVRFSSQGDRLAAIGGWTFNVYDVYSGEVLWSGNHHSGTNDLTFVGHDKVISTGFDGLKVWEGETGTLLNTLEDYQNILGLSPDQSKVFVTRQQINGVRISCLNTDDLTVLWEDSEDRYVADSDLNNDGSILLVTIQSNPAPVLFFDANTGTIVHEISDLDYTGECRFSPDGSLYALKTNSILAMYQYPTHSMLWQVTDYQNFTNKQFSFSPDGNTFIFSRGDTLLAVDPLTGSLQWSNTLTTLAMINEMDFSPDSEKLLAAHRDYILRLWDVQTGAELWSFPFEAWSSCIYSPDNNRFAGGDTESSLKMWIEKHWMETERN